MNACTVDLIRANDISHGVDFQSITRILRSGRDQGHHERLAKHSTIAVEYEFNYYTIIDGHPYIMGSSQSVIIAVAPSFSTEVYANEDDYGITYNRKTNLEKYLIFVKRPEPRVIFHELLHALVGPEFSFCSDGTCGVLFDWVYDNTNFLQSLIQCATSISADLKAWTESNAKEREEVS